MPISVVVVDDHHLFREGVRAVLETVPDMVLVGEAATTMEAVAVVGDLVPDIVLMDLNLPGGGGAVAAEEILRTHPTVKIIAVTMHTDSAHLRAALSAGVRGYLVKNAEPEAIIGAIIAIHRDQLIFDPAVAGQILQTTTSAQASPFPSLTDRELAILDRLARGLRTDAIATRLNISRKTVQNHISSILLKLGAADRTQAVAIAHDAGLGAGTADAGSPRAGRLPPTGPSSPSRPDG